ncbi:hypothetical protein Tcan_03304 [Toxocara canis]|uniref:Uncharacterized protein n=1 Tax=Toxocara canis TaxID=6265 RepID=A0A0B2W3D3_TOXCA|nr:hypothetical protein Tcan_03304 [Toxocara canis]
MTASTKKNLHEIGGRFCIHKLDHNAQIGHPPISALSTHDSADPPFVLKERLKASQFNETRKIFFISYFEATAKCLG